MEIARVFLDVSMSLSFPGLSELMRKSKLDPQTIPPEKFTVFINRKQSAFKVLIGPHHLIYHNNGSRKFPLEAIQEFPRFFDGKRIDFNRAARRVIESKYYGLNERGSKNENDNPRKRSRV